MFARTIELPRATSRGWLLITVAASIGSVVLAGLQPERMWYFVCLLIGSWASYWHTARRPSPLAFDSDGLVYEKHSIRWADVASIEPPSANGEITLRLRRALPDRLDPGDRRRQGLAAAAVSQVRARSARRLHAARRHVARSRMAARRPRRRPAARRAHRRGRGDRCHAG